MKRFTGMPWSICDRSEEIENKDVCLRKRLGTIDLSQALWSVGTRFRR